MFKWLKAAATATLVYAGLSLLMAAPAAAQNTTCATRPVGDNSNACASTAYVNNGFFPISGGTITGPVVIEGSGVWSYIGMYGLTNAQLAVYGASVVNGQQAIACAVRINGGASSSALCDIGWAIQDGTGGSSAVPVWVRYSEVRGFPGETGFLQGAEIEVTDLSSRSIAIAQPYNMTPAGLTYAEALGSGGSCGVVLTCGDAGGITRTPQTASQALRIINNGADFECGICFMNTALHGTDGTDGSGGFGVAALLARNQLLQWDTSDGGGRFLFGSTATSAAGLMSLVYANGGMQILNGGLGTNFWYKFGAGSAASDLAFGNGAGTHVADFGLIDGSNAIVNAQTGAEVLLEVNGSAEMAVSASGIQTVQIAPFTTGTVSLGTASLFWTNVFATKFDGVSFTAVGGPPTLTGTCTTGTQLGSTIAGSFHATCTAQTVIIALPAQANGYSCAMSDETTPADVMHQTAHSPTSVTFTGTTAANDLMVFGCTPGF